MAVLGVLEEIHDAFVLEQPLHEVEVGLVILDAVFARRVGPLQAFLELGGGIFEKISSTISTTLMFWKMRQSLVRPRHHSQGRTSAS